jgi:hypothetical protein
MNRYQFDLARPADDAQLRRIIAQTPMEGHISLSFCREPSYFQAAVVDGRFRQTVTARDCHADEVIGFGSRSISDRFVNGQLRTIGYLSGLRLHPAHRNRGLVARGYRYFRQLHGDGRTSMYLTTIAEGNQTGARILTSGRAGLPTYHDFGRFHTLAIPLRRQASLNGSNGVDVRPAEVADTRDIVEFLREQGSRRQFFPDYEEHDFFADNRVLHGLRPQDLLLAYRKDRIVGTLAGWDQHAFRQSVVHSYDPALRWLRPLYNGWATCRRMPRLPAPGKPFRYLVAALGVIADDDPLVFESLLRSLLSRTSTGAAHHLLLGLHERDPSLPIARRYQVTCYTTSLHLVCWEDGEALRTSLDDRAPYLELGSL